MTSRSFDEPGPGTTTRYRHNRPPPATPRADGGAISALPPHQLDFDHCLDVYAQGLDVSRAMDLSHYVEITQHLFERIPVKVTAVDYQPYEDVEDMAAFATRHGELQISTLHPAPYWSLDVTIKTRAVHDWFAHVVPNNDFSWQGEIAAFHASLPHYPEDLHWLVYSELVLQAAQLLTHHNVEQKLVFCRDGEPLRDHQAWRAYTDRRCAPTAEQAQVSHQDYACYIRGFLSSVDTHFSIPTLIESQLGPGCPG